jgi:hypothetical protein
MATPLKAVLTADISKFTKGLSLAGKSVGVLASGVGFLVSVITKLTIALAAAAGGLAVFIKSNVTLIDRLAKVSKVTGFTVRQLQDFRLAAELSGVSSDQADIALRRFSRRLGEAGRNTGELLPALRRLGIAVRDDEGQLRNVNDVLLDFADGIKATKGETAQLSLAFKAFDSEGAELVQTLVGGSAQLTYFSGALDTLGIILSQNAIRNTELFNDSLTILFMSIQKVAQEVVGQLAPALDELIITLIDELAQQIHATEDGMQGLAKTIATKVVGAIQSLTIGIITLYNTAIIPLINGVMSLAQTLNAPGTELNNLKKNLAEFKELAGKGLIDRLTTLSVTSGRTAEILEKKLGKGFMLTKDNIAIAIQAIEDEILRLEGLGQGDFTPLEGISRESIQEIIDIFEELINNIGKAAPEAIVKPIEEVVVKAKMLDTIMSEIFGKDRTKMFWEDWYSSGIGSLTKLGAIAKLLLGEQIFDNLREGLETAGVGDFVKTMSEGLVKAATMFEDALADAVINGKADFDDLANHLKQVLAKAMIQKFITGPIMGLFGLAKGGPAKAGQPYIVGEEGPELFVPKNSGTVVPNHALGNMSGGPGMGMGGQQVTYNINAVDTQSFQQALARDPEFLFNVTQKGARSLPSRG